MIRLFLILTAVATAFGAEKTYAPSKEVLVLNFKDPPAINIFDTPASFQNFKIIENIIFLNEAEECRSKYSNINQTTFYKHLYCSLKNEKYTTSIGISCIMTKPLIKKIQKRLNDFIVFRNLPKMKEFCWENDVRSKRNSLDSDLLPGFELMGESPKEVDKNYVYLGPSRFPITTELHNRLLRLKEGDVSKKRAENQELTADNKKPKADKQKATAGKKKSKAVNKIRVKDKTKNRKKVKHSSKHHPVRKTKKPLSPKSIFQLFKFRMLKEDDNGDDYTNHKMFDNTNEINDAFDEIEGNSFLYFKLLERLLNIFERFKEHMEKEKNKEFLDDENKEIDDVKEENEKEEEKEEIAGDEGVGVEEEEDTEKPKIFSSLKNNYKPEAPELYYTLSWEDGTKVK